MPELPEVERVRLTLAEHVLGLRVAGVHTHRPDVIRGDPGPGGPLAGRVIRQIDRRGKQLALLTGGGPNGSAPCACVHLGMTGSLRFLPPDAHNGTATHTHVIWRLSHPDGRPGGSVVFADPRRFGGIWVFDSARELVSQRWSTLGEDALTIRPGVLHERLHTTKRSIKAALLDQTLIAGLGNIYVDELLFGEGIHPEAAARRLSRQQVARLVGAIRRLLRRAIRCGGSSLRDYVDADGVRGGFQQLHKVYGRAGQPCVRCRSELRSIPVAGRTSVYCRRCQPKGRRPAVLSDR